MLMTNPQYWVQNRRDVSQNWLTYNPTLRAGELGIEQDTGRAKMGDGVTPWNSLIYWNPAGAAVGADAAPLTSPAFNGIPTAPTATTGTNTTQIATTAFVAAALSGVSGSVSSVFGRTGAVTAESSDYSSYYDSAGSAATAQSNAESFATSAVATETSRAEAAESTNATAISNEISRAETAESLKAPLASPALTGTPTAPTASSGTNTTQIATTAFVAAAMTAAGAGTVTSVSVVAANGFNGTVATSTSTPAITLSTSVTGILKGNGTAVSAASAGVDYLTPTGSGSNLTGITVSQVSGAAPLASPSLTGTPTAPTASSGTNTTQLATTAFVTAAVAAGGGSGAVPGMNVIWMDSHGVSNTGASSVTTEFNTLLAAQDGNPCVFVFGVGTYLWSTAPNSLTTGQSVIGWGSTATNFTWSGSGPLFTATMTVTESWNGSANAGQFSGFSITGPYGTGGTAGIKYGALQGIRIDDVAFYGLDGTAVAGYAVSTNDWAEEAVMTRLAMSGCGATSGNCFSFTGTSFDYSYIDALVVVSANIDVIALNSADMQGLDLHIRGNLHGGTSNTGALISMDRASSSDHSLIGGGCFSVTMEGDSTSDGGSGTVGHYLVYMNSTSSASQFQAQGVLNVYNAGAEGQGIYNPNYCPFGFSGLLNDGTLQMLDGEALIAQGAVGYTTIGMGFGTANTGTYTVYNEFSDVFSILLVTGSMTLVMDAASNFIRKYTFLFKNPSSGSASITFPSNFYWAGGTLAPTTTASAINKVDCLYDPVSDVYYCQLTAGYKAYTGTYPVTFGG
jgi:hypothetical protein